MELYITYSFIFDLFHSMYLWSSTYLHVTTYSCSLLLFTVIEYSIIQIFFHSADNGYLVDFSFLLLWITLLCSYFYINAFIYIMHYTCILMQRHTFVSKLMVPIYTPPAVCESSNCSHTCQFLLFLSSLNVSYSVRYIVVSHCSFNLYFLLLLMSLSPFHICIGHLDILSLWRLCPLTDL